MLRSDAYRDYRDCSQPFGERLVVEGGNLKVPPNPRCGEDDRGAGGPDRYESPYKSPTTASSEHDAFVKVFGTYRAILDC